MIAFYVILCVIIIGLVYCILETTFLRTVSYDIDSDKLSPETDGTRIILLSDLHCKSFGRDNSVLFERIRALEPDIIVISGDLINGLPARKKDYSFSYASSFLTGLKAIGCPVYYEFGNHEQKLKAIGEDVFQSYVELVSPLCALINNSCCTLKEGITLSGLVLERKYFKGNVAANRRRLKIRPYLGKCDRTEFNIMVAHDPTYADRYFRWGADLVLSGHLHGGIIRIPFIGGLISPRCELFPKQDRGLYSYGDGKLIISGGLGWHGVPVRFNNIPEILVINLHSKR